MIEILIQRETKDVRATKLLMAIVENAFHGRLLSLSKWAGDNLISRKDTLHALTILQKMNLPFLEIRGDSFDSDKDITFCLEKNVFLKYFLGRKGKTKEDAKSATIAHSTKSTMILGCSHTFTQNSKKSSGLYINPQKKKFFLGFPLEDKKVEKNATKKRGSKDEEIWMVMTKQLKSAISSTRKINVTSRAETWQNAFHDLHHVDNVPLDRIQKVLSWYCTHLHQGLGPYTPVAHSGTTFREKFLRIESAMKRDNNPQSSAEPSKIILSEDEKVLYLSLKAEMDGKLQTQKGLKELVHKYSVRNQDTTANLNKAIRDRSILRIYTRLFSSRPFLTGLLLWAVEETKTWSKWGGDLAIFAPPGKNFDRYVDYLLSRHGLKPAEKIRNLLR